MSEPEKFRLVWCPKCGNLIPELPDNYSVNHCAGCGALFRAYENVEADNLTQKSDEEMVRGASEKLCHKSDHLELSEHQINLRDDLENDVIFNSSSSKWVASNALQLNENIDESDHSEMGKDFANGSRTLGQIADWRTGEEGGEVVGGFLRKPRRDVQGMRYSTSKFPEEGPSNYNSRFGYEYGAQLKDQNRPDKFNKVEDLQQDQGELLRKLDELKDELRRSCSVSEKPKEKFPLEPRVCFSDGSWGFNRASVHDSKLDTYVSRPSYISDYPKPSSNYYVDRHEMDMFRFYPSLHDSNQAQRFGDPLQSQMLRRGPHQAPDPLQPPPPQLYFELYPPYMNLHHPSCSCPHCYNKHPRDSDPVPTPFFDNKMFPGVPNNPTFYPHGNPGQFGPRDYNPQISNNGRLNSYNQPHFTRWPSYLDSEFSVLRCPPRVVLSTGGRRCSPIAGGAPFVTCYNCFELLQLPKKIFLLEKSQKKVRCGACSTVILFRVVNKKLVFSAHSETQRTLVGDHSNSVTVRGSNSHSSEHANQGTMNFLSDDYDNSGCGFQSMDTEVISSLTSNSAETGSLYSTYPYSSGDKDTSESLNAQGKESNSTELQGNVNQSPPQMGSPLEDHFDDSNQCQMVNRQSGDFEGDKGEQKKAASQQNSTKDALLATEMEMSSNEDSNTGTPLESSRQNSTKDALLTTEMEMSSNEDSNTGTPLESGDSKGEEDRLRVRKGNQSVFAGTTKKSLREFLMSNEIEEITSDVTVNGHPIPDRSLKEAEKLAGPIRPGQYWYDFRAGFWGAMGGPCLGIIPPFIKEFNHPMSEDCAGGNTGVFVNGRELHQKDLNRLSSRGLPTTTARSYAIEISGKVVDEDSGEKLKSLGKLAPTVGTSSRGFGMKVPRPRAAA